MTASEVLEQLHELGVTVCLNGPKVRLEPASVIPSDLLRQVREHKDEIVTELRPAQADGLMSALIARLQAGQTWLLDQHHRWQASDPNAASDEEFSRVWAAWWELDERLRTDYGFQGCVYGPEGTCPDGFPCLGCSELPSPDVVSQLAMT